MKNKKLFDKTISILVNAYLKGTLKHADNCACAVGNMIAANNNYKVLRAKHYEGLTWITEDGEHIISRWTFDLRIRRLKDIPQLKCTGYTILEIDKIERAFEDAFDDPTGYLGLMNVVDALIEIHQGTTTHKKEAKELFKVVLF